MRATVWMCLCLALACGPSKGGAEGSGSADETGSESGTATGTGDTGSVDDCRQLDDWRVEVDTVLPEMAFPPSPGIGEILIGDNGFDDNFVNRGDVIVRFDGNLDQIVVELRRFSCAQTSELAEEDFARLQLWAYNANTSQPKPPAEMDPESNCATTAWQDGCAIKVYYDGQTQPARVGADIRVTLPPNYTGFVDIETTDNTAEDDYQSRGNVCVSGLPGTLQAALQSGVAEIALAPGIRPVPSCSPADTQACEDAGWDPLCPCGTDFGQARVESTGAANITFDVPESLWAKFTFENQDPSQTEAGAHCTATVDHPSAVIESMSPWQLTGEANHPDNGLQGGGYGLTATTAACGQIIGQQRGNLRACVGCLADPSCD